MKRAFIRCFKRECSPPLEKIDSPGAARNTGGEGMAFHEHFTCVFLQEAACKAVVEIRLMKRDEMDVKQHETFHVLGVFHPEKNEMDARQPTIESRLLFRHLAVVLLRDRI